MMDSQLSLGLIWGFAAGVWTVNALMLIAGLT